MSPPEREASTCRPFRQDIEPWLDGDLPVDRRTRLQRHLTDCAECRAAAELARRLQSTLRDLPELAPPPRVLHTIYTRAEEARRRPSVPRLAWTGAALALLVGVVAWWNAVGPGERSGRFARGPAERVASPADDLEVARATAELRLALARLGAIEHKARMRAIAVVGRELTSAAARPLTRTRVELERSAPPSSASVPGNLPERSRA